VECRSGRSTQITKSLADQCPQGFYIYYSTHDALRNRFKVFARIARQANIPASSGPELLLGDMNMEHTLETHGSIGVIPCLDGTDGQHVVLAGHGRAFQPALRYLAGDSSRAG
jgi:hypothetical protein